MRASRRRFDVDKLYIFGAGASLAATYQSNIAKRKITPLDKNFCKRIKELDYERPSWVTTAKEELLKNFKDNRDFDTFGLEEAIITQVGHLNFFDAIHKRRRNSYNEKKFIIQIAYLISFILRKARESKKNLYERIAGKIIDQDHPPMTKNRVITFNYDEVLDKHFLAKFEPYEVYFDKIFPSRSGALKSANKNSYPYIVKLHGSVNWRCYKKDFTEMLNGNHTSASPYKIQRVWYSKKKDPSPDEDIVSCIIPPLPNKPITRVKLFNYLWTKAYEYLHEAKELIICGYSLPPTDNLATSLFSNFTNTKLKLITLIDPNPSIFTTWKELFKRKGMDKVKFEYALSFEEYLESQAVE
jgi:hypothetical protein